MQELFFFHSLINWYCSAGYGEDLFNFMEIPQSEELHVPAGPDCFSLRPVTFHEVLHELYRSDTLTGPDLIPAKFLIPVAH